MRERWILYSKRADFMRIAREYHINPVTAKVMRNRDVEKEEDIRSYLLGTKETLYSPYLMKDAKKAAEMISRAVSRGAKIAIASDFDNDGIFSSMVLYEAIIGLGGRAEIYTPHRVLEGYGLNERIVTEAAKAGAQMILTCDNGIAAFEAIELAKQMGLTVIVTDHHEVPYEDTPQGRRYMLPKADAIVNPKQEDCGYPYKNLCGTGVAYKLIELLYDLKGRKKEEVWRWLD